MPISVKRGGAWSKVTQPSVRNAGAWKKVKTAFVKRAGVWDLVFQNAPPLLLPVEPSVPTYVSQATANVAGSAPVTNWSVTIPSSVQDGDLLILCLALNVAASAPNVSFAGAVRDWAMTSLFSLTTVTSYGRYYARRWQAGRGDVNSTSGRRIDIVLSVACGGQATVLVYRPASPGACWPVIREVSNTTTTANSVSGTADAGAHSRPLAVGYYTSATTSVSWTPSGGSQRACSISAATQGRANCVRDWTTSGWSGVPVGITDTGNATATLGINVWPLAGSRVPGEFVDARANGISSTASVITIEGIGATAVGDRVLLAFYGAAINTVVPSGMCDDWTQIASEVATERLDVFVGTVARLENPSVSRPNSSNFTGFPVLMMASFRGLTPGDASAIATSQATGTTMPAPSIVSPIDNAPVAVFGARATNIASGVGSGAAVDTQRGIVAHVGGSDTVGQLTLQFGFPNQQAGQAASVGANITSVYSTSARTLGASIGMRTAA